MRFLHKIVVSIAVLSVVGSMATASAQHYVGIKGGYGSSDVRLYPAWKTPVELGMLSGGLVWRYYSEPTAAQPALKYTGGISMELQYLQRGYKYESLTNENHTYSRRINTLMLPLIWQPHISMAQERLRLFLNLGVTFNYNLSSTYHTYVTESGETVDKGNYEMLLIRDNRWGYGLCGGLGAEVKLAGRVSLFVEGRYDFGYSDILKAETKYPPNIFQRSPMDNITVSLGLFYRLGGEDSGAMRRRAAKVAAEVVESLTENGLE